MIKAPPHIMEPKQIQQLRTPIKKTSYLLAVKLNAILFFVSNENG